MFEYKVGSAAALTPLDTKEEVNNTVMGSSGPLPAAERKELQAVDAEAPLSRREVGKWRLQAPPKYWWLS